MQFTTTLTIAALTALTHSLPAEYAASPRGWESITYPPGTGEGLHEYPAPSGGWESVTYPPGTGAGAGADCPATVSTFPFVFTSTYSVVAVGDQVRNGTTAAPGSADAVGYFNFGINSVEDTICYNITLLNVSGDYQSPAKTATHLHEAVRGASGPPRLSFPNPVGDDKRRVSFGCLTGPFTTGLAAGELADSGMGFKVAQIEVNPEGFFADSHTVLFPLGVVRGQLA
ncbi:hypothetical protein BJ878DRAFT_452036 [Calycina marina]|uniref:CHRD domain-containing protein n=1 Tax=Calycina marina TaxID=1763456 RepID=A0A9P8CKH2_9HELO|nr:hypothetical protein BJ878DRAFT_452036 [Calycina marina]